MKALVKYASGKGNVGIREMPEPTPNPGEVKVEVKFCGICGTDIHIYYDHYKSNPPVILGHEWSGEVVEVGANVRNVKVGDELQVYHQVTHVGDVDIVCEGETALCNDRLSYGIGCNGAFAKYAVFAEKNIQRLPDNVKFRIGALTEPLAVCVKAVILVTGISAGEVVFITGPGPIGLLATQLAKVEGTLSWQGRLLTRNA